MTICSPIRRRIRGSALILVLWLVMLMTMVVTVTARISRLDTYTSQYSIERIRCQWAARAGAETALALLLADDTNTDSYHDLWADNPNQLEEISLDGSRFTVRVTDESAKLNVNTAGEELLYYLPDATVEIVESVLDWIDQDQETRPGGAEIGYYYNLPNGYLCRDGEIESIREMLLIKDMDEMLFYGPGPDSTIWSENEGWFYYLTCCGASPTQNADGTSKININTAGNNQLRELSLSQDQITWIRNNRNFNSLLELTGEQQSGSNNSSGGSSGQSRSVSNTSSSSTSSSPSSPSSSSGSSRNSSSATSSSSSRSSNSSGSSRTSGGSRSASNSNNSSNQSNDEGQPLDWNTLLRIADQITLDNSATVTGKINLNTANRMVLETLFEGQREPAEAILAYRQGREYGIESFQELSGIDGLSQSQLKKVIDRITLQSSVFRIESVGISEATGQQVLLDVVVNRDLTDRKFLYWRQQEEQPRTKTDYL